MDSTPPTIEPLLSSRELSERLRVSRSLINQLARIGKIPFVAITGARGDRRYRLGDVLDSLGAQRLPVPGEPAPTLLSRTEAAPLLGISVRLLDTQLADGSIPHLRLGDRPMFWPLDLEDWIRAREKRATA